MGDPWYASAAITCETATDSSTVQFLQYRTPAGMETYLNHAAQSVNGAGDCNQGQEMNGSWYTSAGVFLGRTVCIFLKNGDFQINWTFAAKLIVVIREDHSALSAARWWHENACVLTTC
jgi:hypothetical protein